MNTGTDEERSGASNVPYEPAALAGLGRFRLTLLATILLALISVITLASLHHPVSAAPIRQVGPEGPNEPQAGSLAPSGANLERNLFESYFQVLGDSATVHTYPTLTGDVDGDGCMDLIFVGQNWSGAGLNVRVKRSNCDGTWRAWSQVLAGHAAGQRFFTS